MGSATLSGSKQNKSRNSATVIISVF